MIPKFGHKVAALFSGSSRGPSDSRTGNTRRRLEFEGLEERMLLSWSSLASLPTPRQHFAAVTGEDGKIYAIGGQGSNGQSLNKLEIYDPATNTWTTGANMPTARFDLAAAVGSDGRIYAVGGSSFAGHTLSTVEVYNPAANTWTTAASLSSPRDQLAAVVGQDGHIYVLGGHQHLATSGTPDVNLTTVESYDPATNTWTAETSLPTARAGLAAAVDAGGHIYAFGGGTKIVEAYDPTADTWATVTLMPTERTGLAAVTGADGNIYTIGGLAQVNGGVTSTVEAYLPTTNAWAIVENLPSARDFLAAAVGTDGRLYALGGTTGNGALGTVQSFTPENVHTNPNQLFVTNLYQDLLHRPVDASGLQFWSNVLDRGLTTRGVLAFILEITPEYKIRVVQEIYSSLLNRPADSNGLNFFVQFMSIGGSIGQIKAIIMGSEEYFGIHGGNNEQFLEAIYQDALGRPIDAAGKQTFSQALANGSFRGQVAATLLFSKEGLGFLVKGMFQTFLQRPVDPVSLDFFVNEMQHGRDQLQVLARLLNTDEYFALS